ncbi:MAG TPA: DNA helicase RecG [Deltaproteobacteria bacterium]|nr:DNA helicase RecG [Deltaproteobacteria bacterium]
MKPLGFASKDNFSKIESLKCIEPLVNKLVDEAIGAGGPASMSGLKEAFRGFDALLKGEKIERVKKALALASSILSPSRKRPVLTALEARESLKTLKAPLSSVKGIGPKLSELFAKKGLSTIEDVLYFLPIRYEDRRNIKRIKELLPGEHGLTTGEVLASGEARYGKRRVFEAALGDGSAILKLKWFNYRPVYMRNRFKNGQRLIVFGPVSAFGGHKEIVHPDIELFDEEDASQAPGIVPIYSQIERFHQKTVRKIVKDIAERYSAYAVSGAPDSVMDALDLPDLSDAFRALHKTSGFEDDSNTAKARRALVFDELFVLELMLGLKKRGAKKEEGIALAGKSVLEGRLRGLVPFNLTRAQEKVLSEIKADMASSHPMNRLIQGDVGSGKTVVSFVAALTAVEAGFQAAIMAPTEILAEQHYLNIHRYAEALGIRAMLLKGGMGRAERREALSAVKEGRADLVVGTHALIQKDVEFAKLGLAVIDEQHRFGVVQRAILKKKGARSGDGVSPDILIMTATPIPRTLSMTVFGDLDVSIIDELPPGRKPVSTRILREKDRREAYDIIRRELAGGSQCYIVYPLVEESEELSLKDATNMSEHLQRDIFPVHRVGLLHGRMGATEKEAVMDAFKKKRLDILVSTTVVEVGVDVPNATVMLIEHAERFGLAQLHQLRGRVGRGEKRSVCLLLAAWTQSEDTYKRLKVMEETNDGFRIAEEDLNIRGPGDFVGTRQSGLPDFRMSEALTDAGLLKTAREEAFRFLDKDPSLSGPEGVRIKEVLKARWEGRLELAEIG